MKLASILEMIRQLANKKVNRKSIAQYKEDVLIRQGREQFQELLNKGLGIPVALL